MVKVKHKKLDKSVDIDRVIGSYSKKEPGPTVIFMGGTHGNETSSIFALDEIFSTLKEEQLPFKGEMVAAFAGNLKALEEGVRFIDRDMNRVWVPKRLKKLGFYDKRNIPKGHEKEEQEEVIGLLEDTIEDAEGEVYIFDLHTTSSESPPFIAIADTLRNRDFALQYPLPCVIGFDEEMDGTFMNFMNEMGLKGVAYEAGEHFSMAAIENNISFIWYTLYLTGAMQKEDIPDFQHHHDILAKTELKDQRLFDLRHRYVIEEDEDFRMKPGFYTFDTISEGQLIAENQDGEIRAKESGRIFMPLYQKQGDDGFFIIREISERWLNLSSFLRKNNFYKTLPWLPGIKKHPDDEHTLIINSEKRFDRLRGTLHLMGYRRRRHENGKVIVTKRQFDVQTPKYYLLDLEEVQEKPSETASP